MGVRVEDFGDELVGGGGWVGGVDGGVLGNHEEGPDPVGDYG